MIRRALLFSALALAHAMAVRAQHPAELSGHVVDAGTRARIAGVLVEIAGTPHRTMTDAAGEFRFRGVDAGEYVVRASHIGYAEHTESVRLASGTAGTMIMELTPAPFALRALQVAGNRSDAATLARPEIEASGARTVGALVATLPGVVMTARSLGGEETVSIRGAPSSAVLVLVDGVAQNDPVTGAADLSRISLDAVESVTVLRGAQSARYGPRAEAGVIVIETRRREFTPALALHAGSLGERGLRAEWGGGRRVAMLVGTSYHTVNGAFDFDLPAEAGGGDARRANADARSFDVWSAGALSAAGGTLRMRAAWGDTDRGMPGVGYAPAVHARQELERLRASAAWQHIAAARRTALTLAAEAHRARFHDEDPPFGPAYDAANRFRTLAFDAEHERQFTGVVRSVGAGVQTRTLRIVADALAPAAPLEQTQAGVFGSAQLQPLQPVLVAVQLRADRDALTESIRVSHSLGVQADVGAVTVRAAHRSSFSPPALGDQFFRDGFAVEPNPDLRAERVPAEVEVGVRGEVAVAGWLASADVAGYTSDIRDMIVWAPDYRFVWSPRNFDTRRRGVEVSGEVRSPAEHVRVGGSYTLTRMTYDRPGSRDDDVQVIYRPRHTAALDAELRLAAWQLSGTAQFTGVRYPVPAPLNRLPAFWTLSAAARREWRVANTLVSTALHVDRLRDERSTLIFGFPHPGRTLRLELVLRPDRPDLQ